MGSSDFMAKLPLPIVLRYGYSGFLMLTAVTVQNPSAVSTWVDATGQVLAALAVFFLGACIYVLHRHVLAELLLCHVMHFCHRILDRIDGKDVRSGPTGLLGQRGVRFGLRRAAYTEIRRRFFDAETRDSLDVAHSEIHVVYLTAVVLTLTGIYGILATPPQPHTTALFVAGGIVFLAAIATDIRQHRVEGRLLCAADQEQLTKFLSERSFTHTSPSA